MGDLPRHGITEGLIGLATPIDDLYQLPGNPRRGDVAAVRRSYERFGQMKAIVCQPDGMIISGNHQWLAAKELGWTHIAVVRSGFDEVTAKAFALADNRTAELGSNDPDDLLAMIRSLPLEEEPAILAAISYSDENVAELAKLLESRLPEPGDAPTTDTLPQVFGVIVECADESEQVTLLQEMADRGWKVRALMG